VRWLVAAIALAAALAAACKDPPKELSGVGPYRFGHTTLGSLHDGRCQPTTLADGRAATWCFAFTPIRTAKTDGDDAALDLYFLGGEPSAPLIEIQLQIRGCHESTLDRWMRAQFGAPFETKTTRSYWQNSHLFAAALMPSEPGRCRVHVLPPSESAEIARIKKL
jgi:hypothetical protein